MREKRKPDEPKDIAGGKSKGKQKVVPKQKKSKYKVVARPATGGPLIREGGQPKKKRVQKPGTLVDETTEESEYEAGRSEFDSDDSNFEEIDAYDSEHVPLTQTMKKIKETLVASQTATYTVAPSSSTVPPVNPILFLDRFTTDEALANYMGYLSSRKLVPEVGLVLDDTHREFKENLVKRHWNTLMVEPTGLINLTLF